MDAPLLHTITDALAQEVGHPLRRGPGGPSDVEWALLVAKVDSMEKTLGELAKEIRSFNELAINRCRSCENADSLQDHEDRIRDLEKLVYKAMGVATVVATMLSFFLNKIFN